MRKPLDHSATTGTPLSSSGAAASSSTVGQDTVRSTRRKAERKEKCSKRLRHEESRGKKREGRDIGECETAVDEEDVDRDIAVRGHGTNGWQEIQQMPQTEAWSLGSVKSSQTEMPNKLEEFLRSCKGVEDLSDDEFTELRVPSSEMITCAVSEIFSSSTFTPHATRLGFPK